MGRDDFIYLKLLMFVLFVLYLLNTLFIFSSLLPVTYILQRFILKFQYSKLTMLDSLERNLGELFFPYDPISCRPRDVFVIIDLMFLLELIKWFYADNPFHLLIVGCFSYR